MKKVVGLIAALLLLLGTLAAASESVKLTKISGQVMDEKGNLLVAALLLEDTAQNTRAVHFTDMTGRFDLEVPKGEYLLVIQRNGVYEKLLFPLSVKSRVPKALGEIRLKRLVDLPGRGWYLGDLHQHTLFSDGQDTALELLTADLAAGLNFAFITDHNSVEGFGEFGILPCLNQAGVPFLALPGIEVTSKDKGHFNVLNTSALYPFDFSTPDAFAETVKDAKNSGTFVQMNHPSRPDILGMAYWQHIGLFDGMEVWNGKDLPPLYATNLLAKEKWFELLNAGLKLSATASSDVHSVRGQALPADANDLTKAWYQRELLAGSPCTAVSMRTPGIDSLLNSLKQGRAFLTNGPVVLAEIEGKTYGDTVSPGDCVLKIEIWNNEALNTLSLLKNGKTVQKTALKGLSYAGELPLSLAAGDWIVLEVEAENLGYALTNPIWCE